MRIKTIDGQPLIVKATQEFSKLDDPREVAHYLAQTFADTLELIGRQIQSDPFVLIDSIVSIEVVIGVRGEVEDDDHE